MLTLFFFLSLYSLLIIQYTFSVELIYEDPGIHFIILVRQTRVNIAIYEEVPFKLKFLFLWDGTLKYIFAFHIMTLCKAYNFIIYILLVLQINLLLHYWWFPWRTQLLAKFSNLSNAVQLLSLIISLQKSIFMYFFAKLMFL